MKVIKIHKIDLIEYAGISGDFEYDWQIYEIIYTFPNFWMKNKITLGIRMGNVKRVIKHHFPWRFII